jgi:hypothetical protein
VFTRHRVLPRHGHHNLAVLFGPLAACTTARTDVELQLRPVHAQGVAAEGFTRLTYEIEPADGGVTKLTVIHDLTGAPKLQLLLAGGMESQGAGGGWSWVLSDLKSLLETGKSFQA